VKFAFRFSRNARSLPPVCVENPGRTGRSSAQALSGPGRAHGSSPSSRADGHRAPGEDLLRDLPRRVIKPAPGRPCSPVRSRTPLRGDHLPGEDQFLRDVPTDQARQALRSAVSRDDSRFTSGWRTWPCRAISRSHAIATSHPASAKPLITPMTGCGIDSMKARPVGRGGRNRAPPASRTLSSRRCRPGDERLLPAPSGGPLPRPAAPRVPPWPRRAPAPLRDSGRSGISAVEVTVAIRSVTSTSRFS